MADRYFVESPIEDEHARLAGAEAHHLAHVMRASVGTQITLFDGSGCEFLARVERVGRAEIELAVVERRLVDREATCEVTLGVALPKGDRQRWLVEKATELGVARLVPLVTQRSNEGLSESGRGKLSRAVIEASKQCGRNRLMEVAAPVALAAFLASRAGDSTRLVAHPGGEELQAMFESSTSPTVPPQVAIVIGPEGGLTDAEVEQARAAGWRPVGLGSRILRIETAAIALASACLLRCGN